MSRPWIAVAIATWMITTVIAQNSTLEPLDPGPVSGVAALASDPVEGRFGYWVVAVTEDGALLFDIDKSGGFGRGDMVSFEGMSRGDPGRRGVYEYRARVRVTSISLVSASSSIPLRLGDALRNRVMSALEPFDAGRGLLAGFLIGDTSGIGAADIEAMRLAGLSHFVAVSGSNVALFLGLLVFAAGPLALGPKRRALVGLIGLPVYAAATRFEPSVMRASVMAAIALGGRLFGIVLEAWQLLSLAVIVLLVLDPRLTSSAGFQLSVAATAGVLVGARWPLSGGRVARALAVTVGAQIAVAPLLLIHFGSVPMMSPVVNLVAAPIVAASTLIGAVGVAGPSFLLHIAAWLADLVLLLARGAAIWPQLEPVPLLVILLAGFVTVRFPPSRSAVAVGGAVIVVVLVLGGGSPVPDPGVIVLDVGQGDAILIHGGDDTYALVDGGPDALVLADRLRKYGVDRLDLVVLTHVHADHIAGLSGLVGKVSLGQVWIRTDPHVSAELERLTSALRDYGVPVVEPQVGDTFRLGSLRLVVEGPLRKYASPNDQSLVLTVRGSERTMLLAGDIETLAQGELSYLRADVLKVPHQGAGTSDPEWLEEVGADLAVISVGPNQFGHPVGWVIEVLEGSGAEVVRTDEVGDVVVPLS
ncbi:MAG: ComEC/Rec2 family competence protein [Acidimicrobiia bacterium]